MSRIIFSRSRRNSSSSQEMRALFWLISNPETPTPPALTALAGPKRTLASMKASTAPCSQGMFAASAIALTPFLIIAAASSAFTSFCVAEGTAQSASTFQGRPSWKVTLENSSAASDILPRRTPLRSFIQSICSCVKPSEQWTKPPESERVSGKAPSCRHFSAAWVATLPEPEIRTFFPSIVSLCWTSIFLKKKIAP